MATPEDVLGRLTLVTGPEEFLGERAVAAVKTAVRAHDAESEFSETKTQPPQLRWRSMKRARFYNVQLYRKGSKILSIWPARARLKLHKRWKYNGRSFRLVRGSYTWLVWPAYGTRKKPNFGSRLGQSTFKIVARR